MPSHYKQRFLFDEPANIDSHVLAYTAGIIDGEGCISIVNHRTKTRDAKTTVPYHNLDVGVCNTDEGLIDFLVRHFGGTKQRGRRPNRKVYYKWALATRSAEMFLRLIYPYLVIKKQQADIAFAFRSTFGNPGVVITPEKLAERSKYHEDMRLLKKASYA